MHTQPYRTLTDYDTTAARCLRLIERHAPRLMRVGGGSIAGEGAYRGNPQGPKLISTLEQRQQVTQLIQQGSLTASEIAARVGVYNQLVHRMAKRAGVRLPDGRAVSRMQPCG